MCYYIKIIKEGDLFISLNSVILFIKHFNSYKQSYFIVFKMFASTLNSMFESS
jgi:hypothetical protein